MDIRELKRIIRLVETSGIEELEIEQEGTRIRVRKGSGLTQTFLPERFLPAPAYPLEPRGGAPHPAALKEGHEAVPAEAAGEVQSPESALSVITSPMVGTFYRSSAPDSPPFVQIGSDVQPETVVCILEAMKVMNEIKAGCSGRIVEILAENNAPVEFGQPLFRVAAS